MTNKTLVCGLSLLALCSLLALSSNVALGATVTTNAVVRTSDGSVVADALSTVVRDATGVTAAIRTSGLEPGAAYTVWWVIFNDPTRCTGTPCDPAKDTPDAVMYAAGNVASSKGTANFGARLNAGDTTGFLEGSGSGLTNPSGAELRLVIRTHGQPLADQLDAQIGSFGGGCPPNTCRNVQRSAHLPFTDDTTARLDAIKKVLDRVARSIPLVP